MNGRTARALRRQTAQMFRRYANRPRMALRGADRRQAYRGLKREYIRARSAR